MELVEDKVWHLTTSQTKVGASFLVEYEGAIARSKMEEHAEKSALTTVHSRASVQSPMGAQKRV